MTSSLTNLSNSFNNVTPSSLHYCNGLTSDGQTQLTNLSNKFTADTGMSVAGLLTGLGGLALGAGALFTISSAGALKAPNFEVDQNGSLGVTGDVHCNNLYAAANIN